MIEWTVYTEDKTCYIFGDGKLVEAFQITRRDEGDQKEYFRSNTLQGEGAFLNLDKADKILAKLKGKDPLLRFTNGSFHVGNNGTKFNDLAAKVDEAGEIASVEVVQAGYEKQRKATEQYTAANAFLTQGYNQLALKSPRKGLEHDPDNKKLKEIVRQCTQ